MSARTNQAPFVTSRRFNQTTVRRATLGAAAAMVALSVARPSIAATGTWIGTTDANWATTTNWVGGVPNATTEDAIFYDPATNTANLNISLGASRAVRSLTFNSNALSPVTLNVSNTNQLTIQGGVTGGDVVVTAGDHKIIGVAGAQVQEIKLGGSTTWNIGAGSLEVNARMIQGSSSNSVTKTGTGTLIFSADQTTGTAQNMGGGYLVTQGTLAFAARKGVGNTGTPVTVSNGATIEWRNFNGSYNGTGGTFTLQGGAHWLVTQATATMSAGANSQLLLGAGNATIETSTAPLTINDDINGAGGFTKTGTNLLTLGDAGTSTYTGKTVISEGRLKLSASATLGNSPSIEVKSGAKFDVTNNASGGLKSFQVFGGTGNVTGAAVFTAGTVAPGMLGTAGTLTFDTSLSLSGTALNLDLTDPSSGNDLIAVTGDLNVASPTVVNVNRLTGSLPAGTYTIATYSGALLSGVATTTTNLQLPQVRQGLTLVDPSTTPGSLQITAGAGAAGSLVWTGAGGTAWNRTDTSFTNGGSPDKFFDWDNVTFDDTSSVLAVDVPGLITPNNVTFANGTNNYTLSGTGNLNAVQTFTKSGTGALTLSVTNASISNLTVSGGTLTLANPNAYAAGSVSVSNTAALKIGDGVTSGAGALGTSPIANAGTLMLNRPDNFTFASAVSGSGSLVKNGAGTATVSGTNTYTGATTVTAGTLKVSSAVNVGDTNGAALTVQSGATFDIGGNTTANNFNLGAKTVKISGSGVGGTAGAIANSGTAVQNAAFNNITLDADALIAGSRMDIGRATAVTTRTLDLGGHTLSLNMSGTNPIFGILDGTTVTAGNIVVSGGVDIERSSVVDNVGGTITFNTNSVLQLFQTTDGAVKRPMVFSGGNTIGGGSTTAAVLNSNLQLDGSVTLQALASGVPGTANNPLDIRGAISGAGGITKAGTNSVTLSGTQTYVGATAANAGTLILGGSSTGSSSLSVADAAVVSVTTGGSKTERFGSLNLNASGKLDMGDARLSIGGALAQTQLVTYIQRGYAAGAWTGTGLTTATALAANDAARIKAIGWAAAGDLGLTGGSWGAASGLAATDMVLKATYYGDLNLDGKVDGGDYSLMDRFVSVNGLGAAGRWLDGDVNYDGTVTAADYILTDIAFGNQSGVLSPDFLAARQAQFGDAYVSQLVAAVPEPTTFGLLAAGSLLALRRRRA